MPRDNDVLLDRISLVRRQMAQRQRRAPTGLGFDQALVVLSLAMGAAVATLAVLALA